jgi:hypothetical protein
MKLLTETLQWGGRPRQGIQCPDNYFSKSSHEIKSHHHEIDNKKAAKPVQYMQGGVATRSI